MVDYFVEKFYHIKGRPSGSYDLTVAQNEIEAKLNTLSTSPVSSCRRLNKRIFFEMLVNAEQGSIFIFDGHSSQDGFIRMRGNNDRRGIDGKDLAAVMKNSHAVLYLDCCFVAQHQWSNIVEDPMRKTVADILSYDTNYNGNITQQVDEWMEHIESGNVPAHDTTFILNKVNYLKTLGLDRSIGRIVPLSIGPLPACCADNDIILRALGASEELIEIESETEEEVGCRRREELWRR
eukprot:gene14642-19670_t